MPDSNAVGLTDIDSSQQPSLLLTETDGALDGTATARVTATVDGRKHRFEIEVSNDSNSTVSIDHQETLNSRGTVTTVQPSDEVVDYVASHEDVRDFVAEATQHNP